MRMYNNAIALAKEHHKNQKRWDGEPYFNHLQRVSDSVSSPYADRNIFMKTAAILHDIVEDTSVTIEDLSKQFPSQVVKLVDLLTHDKDKMSYAEYIKRLSVNEDARAIKIADINDNIRNLKKGSMKDKYLLALEYLELYKNHYDLVNSITTRHNLPYGIEPIFSLKYIGRIKHES